MSFKFVSTSESSIKVWDSKFNLVRAFNPHQSDAPNNSIVCAKFIKGRFFTSCSKNSIASNIIDEKINETKVRSKIKIEIPKDQILCLDVFEEYLPSSQKSTVYVVTATSSNELILWNYEDSKEIKSYSGHDEKITCVLFAEGYDRHGHHIVSGNKQGTILIHNFESGNKAGKTMTSPKSAAINSLAISPRARWLASGSDCGSVLIWDIYTAELLYSFRPHQAPCTKVKFSPKEPSLLMSVGMDKKMRFYDIKEMKMKQEIELPFPVISAEFLADGKLIALGCKSGKILIYNRENGEQLSAFSGHSSSVTSLTCFNQRSDRKKPISSSESISKSSRPSTRTPSSTVSMRYQSQHVNLPSREGEALAKTPSTRPSALSPAKKAGTLPSASIALSPIRPATTNRRRRFQTDSIPKGPSILQEINKSEKNLQREHLLSTKSSLSGSGQRLTVETPLATPLGNYNISTRTTNNTKLMETENLLRGDNFQSRSHPTTTIGKENLLQNKFHQDERGNNNKNDNKNNNDNNNDASDNNNNNSDNRNININNSNSSEIDKNKVVDNNNNNSERYNQSSRIRTTMKAEQASLPSLKTPPTSSSGTHNEQMNVISTKVSSLSTTTTSSSLSTSTTLSTPTTSSLSSISTPTSSSSSSSSSSWSSSSTSSSVTSSLVSNKNPNIQGITSIREPTTTTTTRPCSVTSSRSQANNDIGNTSGNDDGRSLNGIESNNLQIYSKEKSQSNQLKLGDFPFEVLKNVIHDEIQTAHLQIFDQVQNVHAEIINGFYYATTDLTRKMEELCTVNQDLVQEITRLRAENDRLKRNLS